jgi:hypothetical protein
MLLLYLIFPAILIGLASAVWGLVVIKREHVFLTPKRKLTGDSARMAGCFLVILGIGLAVFAWTMASLFPEGLGH